MWAPEPLLREAGAVAGVPASPWVRAQRRDEGCSAGRAAVGCQSGTRLVSTSPSRNCPSCVLADCRQCARRALQGRERKGSASALLRPGPKLYPLSARVTGEQDRYPLRPACRRRSVVLSLGVSFLLTSLSPLPASTAGRKCATCACSGMREIAGHRWLRSGSGKKGRKSACGQSTRLGGRGTRQRGPGYVKRLKAHPDLTFPCPWGASADAPPSLSLTWRLPPGRKSGTF